MSRDRLLGGAGMRMIWAGGGFSGGGSGLAGRTIRLGMEEVWPRDLLE